MQEETSQSSSSHNSISAGAGVMNTARARVSSGGSMHAHVWHCINMYECHRRKWGWQRALRALSGQVSSGVPPLGDARSTGPHCCPAVSQWLLAHQWAYPQPGSAPGRVCAHAP